MYSLRAGLEAHKVDKLQSGRRSKENVALCHLLRCRVTRRCMTSLYVQVVRGVVLQCVVVVCCCSVLKLVTRRRGRKTCNLQPHRDVVDHMRPCCSVLLQCVIAVC